MWADGALRCVKGHRYTTGEAGYLELAPPGSIALSADTTSPHYAEIQLGGGERVIREYLLPWLSGFGTTRVLDAGCGLGVGLEAMAAGGLDAWGVDMASVAGRWRELGRNPERFFVADVAALPFRDGLFDAVVTLGVIEHVGTTTGHLTLAPDYRNTRQRFMDELVRVTRSGGRVLVAAPNKSFPIDLQHGPNDAATYAPLRTRIFERFGVNVHPVHGRYHLVTYRDLRTWARGRPVRPLPLAGYFGFSALERPGVPTPVGTVAKAWVERMPSQLRASPLNPYVLAEIRV
ncbi:MAG: class I SAM-dependent methyltransferase [Acidimicrobiales bacterium]|nr:class I SAM-dependent methyltransferase [Acidimicrobiales bacterium]